MTVVSSEVTPVGEPQKIGLSPKDIIFDDLMLAERWGLKPHTLRVRRMKGDTPRYFRIGRFIRYTLEAIQEYEREQMEG